MELLEIGVVPQRVELEWTKQNRNMCNASHKKYD